MSKEILTQSRLKELLNYNPDTGIFTRKEPRRGVKVGSVLGSLHNCGYLFATVNREFFYLHRLAWIYMHGKHPIDMIDHINGDKTDNRIKNLRQASNSQNQQNSTTNKRNTSGVKGVSWYARDSKWYAYIQVKNKTLNLGTYFKIEDAISARHSAEVKYFGEFRRNKTMGQ